MHQKWEFIRLLNPENVPNGIPVPPVVSERTRGEIVPVEVLTVHRTIFLKFLSFKYLKNTAYCLPV